MVDDAVAALHVFDLARARELTERARRVSPGFERAGRLQKTIAEVRRLRRRLHEDPPPGLEGEIARARVSTLAGRVFEAEHAWLALLSRPDLPGDVAREGFAFVAQLGSYDALRRTLPVYAKRGDARAELLLAAQARLAVAEHLKREWPRVVRALERLRHETR